MNCRTPVKSFILYDFPSPTFKFFFFLIRKTIEINLTNTLNNHSTCITSFYLSKKIKQNQTATLPKNSTYLSTSPHYDTILNQTNLNAPLPPPIPAHRTLPYNKSKTNNNDNHLLGLPTHMRATVISDISFESGLSDDYALPPDAVSESTCMDASMPSLLMRQSFVDSPSRKIESLEKVSEIC